jgi:hypothetical protein
MQALEDKIAHAKHLIYEWGAGKAVLLCSFGKDSMVLLHLIRQVLEVRSPSCHAYPIPVIYHRYPYFPAKHDFADETIRKWGLEVYDFPPLHCGVKCKEDRLELVTRYQIGKGAIDIPINTEEPILRRQFVCGLEWLLRPKTTGGQWPWTTVFIGHKSSDVDPYEGPVPLKYDQAYLSDAAVNAVFPLRHWTDDDVWDYIEIARVPYDRRRYGNRVEFHDKWLNPDYINACTACIDPRENSSPVHCPKLGGQLVRNMGAQVVRLQQLPEYIQKAEGEKSGSCRTKEEEGPRHGVSSTSNLHRWPATEPGNPERRREPGRCTDKIPGR